MQDNNLNVLLETMNKVIDTLLQEKLDLKVEIKLLKEKIVELECIKDEYNKMFM